MLDAQKHKAERDNEAVKKHDEGLEAILKLTKDIAAEQKRQDPNFLGIEGNADNTKKAIDDSVQELHINDNKLTAQNKKLLIGVFAITVILILVYFMRLSSNPPVVPATSPKNGTTTASE